MGKIIGIDLGTTNCCVCYLDGEERIIVPNPEGGRTTPSVVAFSDDNQRLVGALARRQAETNPENTIFSVKRLMGRRFDDDYVQRVSESVPYEIVKSAKGDAWVRVRSEDYSPPQVSSFILRELRKMAEEFTGEEIKEAIITVPAYFNDAQRQATRDAGKIAGLEVLRIINEPTAAALAYGLGKKDEQQRVAVYDLGGGTFDVSILDLSDGVFSVLATSGDTFLGGEDFDYAIIDWLVEGFKAEHGVDLRGDAIAMQRLKEDAERAKCELSSVDEAQVSLPFIFADENGPKHLEATLTRKEYEGMVADLVKRTLEPCGEALREAGLSKSDIDVVLLVGGMSRMPLVRTQVSMWFQKEVDKSVNPDEVVAMGAAVQGSIIRGELTDVVLLDVTPLTLGIETEGGVFEPLIPKNTTIPFTYQEVFSTTIDNQDMVRIHVAQGERGMIEHNKTLASFELHGIPPAPRGVPKIEVTFSIDANGIVEVVALDLGTGKERSITVVADGGLSEEEIANMVAEAEQNAASDELKKKHVELVNRAQGLVYQTERSLAQYGEYLEEEERFEIKDDVETVKELLDAATPEELEAIIASLEASAYRLAEVMYASLDLDAPPAEPAPADEKSIGSVVEVPSDDDRGA